MLAHAPIIPAPPSVVRWERHWNAWQTGPLRVLGATGCVRIGPSATTCVMLVANAATGHVGCYLVTVTGTSRAIPPAPRIACPAGAVA